MGYLKRKIRKRDIKIKYKINKNKNEKVYFIK